MSVTGLEVFDATVHKTNAWLKRLMAIQGWDNRRLAYLGMRATLHALRSRMSWSARPRTGCSTTPAR